MRPASTRQLIASAAIFAAMLLGQFAAAAGRAGDFDYYVLALSWNASWCATEGDARHSRLCDAGSRIGFTLHGLWPQYEHGYPEYCRTSHRDPSRAETRREGDLFRSQGLAWYQWKKHGRCSGLSAEAYFEAARRAWKAIRRPEVLRQVARPVEVNPRVIEAAFIEANPGLAPDGITVTCSGRRIHEVRICMTRDLAPRACGPDVSRDCRGPATLPPMR